jgi:hypothetical protein
MQTYVLKGGTMEELHNYAKVYAISLENEKKGYEARGLTDRVKAVDAEIARVKKAGRVHPSGEALETAAVKPAK